MTRVNRCFQVVQFQCEFSFSDISFSLRDLSHKMIKCQDHVAREKAGHSSTSSTSRFLHPCRPLGLWGNAKLGLVLRLYNKPSSVKSKVNSEIQNEALVLKIKEYFLLPRAATDSGVGSRVSKVE